MCVFNIEILSFEIQMQSYSTFHLFSLPFFVLLHYFASNFLIRFLLTIVKSFIASILGHLMFLLQCLGCQIINTIQDLPPLPKQPCKIEAVKLLYNYVDMTNLQYYYVCSKWNMSNSIKLINFFSFL